MSTQSNHGKYFQMRDVWRVLTTQLHILSTLNGPKDVAAGVLTNVSAAMAMAVSATKVISNWRWRGFGKGFPAQHLTPDNCR